MGDKDPFHKVPEVLESGSDRAAMGHNGRWIAGVVVLVVIAALIGYAVGHHRGTGEVRAPVSAASPAGSGASAPHSSPAADVVVGESLVQTGTTCSVQHGRKLQLGVQVVNQSEVVAAVTRVTGHAPLRGVRPVAGRTGPCGVLGSSPMPYDAALPPGGTIWLTVTVKVLVRCPQSYPVQFDIRVIDGHRPHTEHLAGFVDLGHVPYSGCRSRNG